MNNQYIKLPNSDVFLEDDDPDTLDYLEMVKNRNRIKLNTSIQFKNVDEQSNIDCSYSVSSHNFVDTFKTNSMSLYSTTEKVSTKVIYKNESDNIYISKEKCDYKMSKENYSCSDISHAA